MSTIIAILVVSLQFVAAALVIITARRRQNLAKCLSIFGLISFAFLGIYYTGGLGTADPAWFVGDATNARVVDDDSRCAELVGLLVKSRVVLSQSASGRVVVNPNPWSKIAEPVRNVTVACLAYANALEPADIQIVEGSGS